MTQYDPQIYPVRLWIEISEDDIKFSRKFVYAGSRNDISPRSYDPTRTCTTSQLLERKSDGQYGATVQIFQPDIINSGIIAHESVHVARVFWDYLGEEEPSPEADAYLVQWIAECIEKELNKYKLKNK